LFILAIASFAGILVLAPDAPAVPVFARKYETSCQTCHVAYPKLNSFGEAFRRNGYRFPAGEDEEASKDEPIALGHQAHKKVFPDAVWPIEIPGGVPLSMQMGSFAFVGPDDPKIDFNSIGGRLGLNFAGTLGSHVSAWAGGGISGSGSGGATAELERVLMVIGIFEEPILNFRIGRFEPGMLGFTMHRTLGLGPWILSSRVGDNQWTLDPTQLGVEATGVFGSGRVTYALGVVEGAGNLTNTFKDLYGRLGFKLGGMRLDGVGGATQADPWRETSVQFGVFGYLGQARIGDPEVAFQDDRFLQVGGDLNLTWRDLNLLAAFSYGRNQRPALADPAAELTSWHAFAQIDYVIYPWLIPTVRYERRKIGDATAERVSGGLYVLFFSNLRGLVLASVEAEEGVFDFRQVVIGLNAAF
jgi:hypothetical protein